MHLSRFVVFGFLGGLVLSVSVACGPTVPEKTCAPGSCTGCCTDTGDCLSGTSVFECGAGGEACTACASNQTCTAGACANFADGDYDASFPDKPDASVNFDAGTFQPADAGTTRDAGMGDAGPANVSFSGTIQPLLANKCSGCHVGRDVYGNIVNRNNLIIPFDPQSSEIYTETAAGTMPKNGTPLTGTQLGQLRDWILNGAPNN